MGSWGVKPNKWRVIHGALVWWCHSHSVLSLCFPRLHQPAYNVTFCVENTGRVYGGDVCDVLLRTCKIWQSSQIPQVYINFPTLSGEPPSVLKGFTHIEALPGEKVSVSIPLSRYDLSVWNVTEQGWQKPEGTIKFTVGTSSRDRRLHRGII